MNIKFNLTCFLMLAIILMVVSTGCKKTGESALQSDSIVLARVNGSPVTQYDLDLTINTMLGQKNVAALGDDGKRKVLESLVASRVIAQKCEKELTDDELGEINKKVQAYREQVLVKKFIAAHITPEPVSQEIVNEYYLAHPEKFGAETIRTYEMISTDTEPQTNERDALLKSLYGADKSYQWATLAAELKTKGFPVFYKKGTVAEKLLHPKISALINEIEEGGTSKLTFVEGRPYLVRVLEIKNTPPRPLNEVSILIRKDLVPVQLKKALTQITADILKTADVVYEKNNND